MANIKEVGISAKIELSSPPSADTCGNAAMLTQTQYYFVNKIPLKLAGGASITAEGKEVITKKDLPPNLRCLIVTTTDGKNHRLPIGPIARITNSSEEVLWEAMFRADETYSIEETSKVIGELEDIR